MTCGNELRYILNELGKEGELYAMPRAPLLAGAVAAGDWGVHRQQLLKSNPTVIASQCHLP